MATGGIGFKAVNIVRSFGFARIIIFLFFVLLCIMAVALQLNLADLITQSLVRISMWGILVLAMLPAIRCGIGPNFGVSLGILCGLVGGLFALELAYRLDDLANVASFSNLQLFAMAIAFSLPFAIITGIAYGWLLNQVKGAEMMIATYIGFSMVSLMKIAWVFLPFISPEMAWPIGRGVRVQISLAERDIARMLNRFLSFTIGEVTVPTGQILFFAFFCLLIWLFMRSKTGLAMFATGSNPRFAEAAGININKCRIIGTTLSTVLGAVGILVYAQSYGFIQLYEAPMFMPFMAVAAIFIGGASITKASIAHVIAGSALFFAILVTATPVFNAFTADWSSMGEISRKILQNGVILFALTQIGGE